MSGPGGVDVSPEERDVLRVIGKSWGWVLFFGIVTVGIGVVVTLHDSTDGRGAGGGARGAFSGR